MSIDDEAGEKWITTGLDTRRWQHRLFAEIRAAPAYPPIFTRLRDVWNATAHMHGHPVFEDPEGCPSVPMMLDAYFFGREPDRPTPYFQALLAAARDLKLTYRGKPVAWAVIYLAHDVVSTFDLDRPATFIGLTDVRTVEVKLSLNKSSVKVHRRDGSALWECQKKHDRLWIGGRKTEWEELEEMAVEAARQAVADIRRAVTSGSDGSETGYSEYYALKQIKGALEDQRRTEITNLAYRLMGRRGSDRNEKYRDRRLCKGLGIDVPRNS